MLLWTACQKQIGLGKQKLLFVSSLSPSLTQVLADRQFTDCRPKFEPLGWMHITVR